MNAERKTSLPLQQLNYKNKIKIKYDRRTPQTSGKSKRKKSNDPQQHKHIPVLLLEKIPFHLPRVQFLINQSINQSNSPPHCVWGGGNMSFLPFFPFFPSPLKIYRVLSFTFVFPVCASARCHALIQPSSLFGGGFLSHLPLFDSSGCRRSTVVVVVVVGSCDFFVPPKESPFHLPSNGRPGKLNMVNKKRKS